MAAGTFTFFGSFFENIGRKNIDLKIDTFKCGFISHSASPTDSLSLWSQVSGNEISASGYTAGGVTLTGVDYTADGSRTYSWKASAFTVSGTGTKKVKWGIVYDISSSPVNRLCGYFDMETGSTTGVEATQITVTFPSNVIAKVRSA